MADKQIISRQSIQQLAQTLKTTFAKKAEVETKVSALETSVGQAIKDAKVDGNSIKLYTSKGTDGDAAVTLDLPAELVLDQAKTKFEGSFAWDAVTYPGTEDPGLNTKPVLVLAVKNGEENDTYSFLDMTKLVDVYTGGTGDNSTTVTVIGNEITVKVKVSSQDNNQLTVKEDGLYVPQPPDITGKADKVEDATEGNLVKLTAEGGLADATIAATDVLTVADVSDFSEAEITALLADEVE